MALFRSKLVSTVRSTDWDSQRVATSASSEVDYFFRVSISVVFCRNFIFHTSQHTQFTFYSYIELMSVVNHFLGQSYVFFVWQVRTVDHYWRESHVDARFAQFEWISVVKVKHDFRMCATQFFCIFYSTFCHVTQQSLVSIVTSTFRYLQDNRRFCFYSSLHDGLQLFHIVEVESRDSISTFDCSGKHISCVHQA